MREGEGRLGISALDEPGVGIGEMAHDVRAGLSTTPKDLSPWPKYFYDAEGSRLFEEITRLPEYYQTRAEFSILRERARGIVSRTGCRELIELGSGSANKTRALLDALPGARDGARDGVREGEASRHAPRYVPLDVDASILKQSGERLLEEYPGLEIRGFVGDFERSLGDLLRLSGDGPGGRLVLFLGGTIGNFTPERRRAFLAELRSGLRPGDHVLIGVDLVKDPRILEAAYDDAAGVTARFNKNLLNVFNARLGADFDPNLFSHRAVYDAHERRIEMWLDSKAAQGVHVRGIDLVVHFDEGEGMRTEISAKFTPESAAQAFEEAGLRLLDLYTDEGNLFGLALGTAS